MKKLLSGIALIPLVLGLFATGCEIEVGDDTSTIATWVGWPSDGRREESTTSILKFTFTKGVDTLVKNDFEVTEASASGFFEITGEPYKGLADGTVWYLPVTPDKIVGEGLAKVTINNSAVEKMLHGVPVFIELDRRGYTLDQVKETVNNESITTKLKLTFDEDSDWSISNLTGDYCLPKAENITLEGDAIIAGPLEVDEAEGVVLIPIAVTKQYGSVVVFIEQAGIARTVGADNTSGYYGYEAAGPGLEAIDPLPSIPSNFNSAVSTGRGHYITGRTEANPSATTGLKKPKTSWSVSVVPSGDSATSEIEFSFGVPIEQFPDSALSFGSSSPVVQANGSAYATDGGYKWIVPIAPVSTATWATTGTDATVTIGTNDEIVDKNESIKVYDGKITWEVSADGVENAKTTTSITVKFSKEVTNPTLTLSDTALGGTWSPTLTSSSPASATYTYSKDAGQTDPEKGLSITGTVSTKKTVTVTIGGDNASTTYKSLTNEVEIYKYVTPTPPPPPPTATTTTPPPPAPESTDPFDGGKYPIAINEAGKNLQIEVYQSNYNKTTKGGYPYGDTTAKAVIEHRDYYQVEIASAGSSTWKKVNSKPQVGNSGKLGSYDNVFWQITPSARNGLGKIQVRIRARRTSNPADPSESNYGAWVTFTNNGKGW